MPEPSLSRSTNALRSVEKPGRNELHLLKPDWKASPWRSTTFSRNNSTIHAEPPLDMDMDICLLAWKEPLQYPSIFNSPFRLEFKFSMEQFKFLFKHQNTFFFCKYTCFWITFPLLSKMMMKTAAATEIARFWDVSLNGSEFNEPFYLLVFFVCFICLLVCSFGCLTFKIKNVVNAKFRDIHICKISKG